jgi:hypothetical protein
MNWTVILTACIVCAIFVGPFYLISRKSGSNHPVDEASDEMNEKGKSIKQSGKKGIVTHR